MREVSDELVAIGRTLSTASLHEACGRRGALPSAIKPVARSMRLCGRALPVNCPPGDNLWLHHAIYEARRGDILVADTGEASEFGYWGEVMTVAAIERGIGGLVISGGIRDADRLASLGFPVFSGAICIRGTAKDPASPGSIGAAVRLSDVTVHAGDLVLGDADGVLVVAAEDAAEALHEAARRDEAELRIFERLRAGETTLRVYQLPALELRSA
jgi:4-hydroxy-4-methyl-2-oxoglutarate aldolase